MKTLKKEINDTAIKGIRKLWFKKETGYYKPVKIGNFWSNNYVEYKNKGDRKALSVKKYLNKVHSKSGNIEIMINDEADVTAVLNHEEIRKICKE